MILADLVAPVVVLGVAQVSVAPLGLAFRRVGRAGLERPGPPVQPVHELILRGREVRTAAKVEPQPRREIQGLRQLLALGDDEDPTGRRVEGEHLGRGVGGRRAAVSAWVEERVDLC